MRMLLKKIDDEIAKNIVAVTGLLLVIAIEGVGLFLGGNSTVRAGFDEVNPTISQNVDYIQPSPDDVQGSEQIGNSGIENNEAGNTGGSNGEIETLPNTENDEEETTNQNTGTTINSATGNANTPDEEYITERVEEIERQISEYLLMQWTPIDINIAYSTSNLGIYKPNLSILKTARTSDSNNSVFGGEPIVYLLQVRNNGNEDLTGINISDVIPPKTTFIEQTIFGGGTYNKDTNKINWKVDIKAGETIAVRYAVLVDTDATGTIKNTAVINGTDTNEVQNPIIKTSKTSQVYRDGKLVKKSPANIGDTIEYTVTIENTGDVAAIANVKDTVPANTKLVSNIVLAGEVIDEAIMIAGKNITIPAGEIETLTFTVEIEKIDGIIKNISNVDEQTPTSEVKTANLEVVQTISKTDEVASDTEKVTLGLNEKADIKIELKNTGSEELELDIEDIIKDTELDLFEENEKIPETIILKPGETKELTATYTMTQEDIDNQEELTNKVTITEEDEKIPEIEKTATITPEEVTPSLYIEKTTSSVTPVGSKTEKPITEDTKVRPGDIITYSIFVKNNGNTTLNDVKVTDSLDVKYNKTLIETAKGEVIEKIKKLAPNAEKTYKVQYEVTQADLDNGLPITNTATATDGTITATDETDKQIQINPNITVSGRKTWEDYNNQEDTRPDSITVEVLQGTKVVDTIKVKASDGWKYTSKELKKYDENNEEIIYTVREKEVAGYTAKIEGHDITNTLDIVPTKTVSGTKTWVDYNNQENTRPSSILVDILNGTEVVDTIEVKVSNNWEYTSKALPKYNGNNEEITYTVREHEVEGYKSEVVGTKIINTLNSVPTKTVTGTKIWDDYNNQENMRTDSIFVDVLQGTKVVDTIEVKASNNWEYTSKALPKYDDNNEEITYTVREHKVEDYTSNVVGTDITNTLDIVPTITVSGSKTWEDYNNQEDTRPDSITVEVLQGTKVVDTIKIKASDGWKYTSKALPKYDENDQTINYTIRESTNGYTTTNADPVKDKDGNIIINITNTLATVPTIKLTGELFWEDENNQDGIRPDNVTISVISSDSTDTTESNATIGKKQNGTYNWTYEFNNLPKYDENDQTIEYTVTATGINEQEYTTTPETTTTDEKTGNITANITSVHEIEKISVSGTINWIGDNNNLNETRPDSIVIKLMNGSTQVTDAQGKKVQVEVTPDENNNWKYCFTGLPKNEKGNPIDYTLKELTITGYTSEIANSVTDAQGNITIDVTNTYIPPELTKVKTSSAGVTVKPNDTITYTIETENIGETLAKSVVITDTVPQFTTLVEDSISGDGVLGEDGQTITWQVGDLVVGEKATVTFSVTVNSTSNAIGKNVVNTGKVNGVATNTVASKVVQYISVSQVIYPIQDVDIVLVLDVSDSMNANNRLTNLKKAAKDFITGMFPEGADNTGSSITVVKFSETASEVGSKAKDYKSAEALKDEIEALTASGGTNIQAAQKITNVGYSEEMVHQRPHLYLQICMDQNTMLILIRFIEIIQKPTLHYRPII